MLQKKIREKDAETLTHNENGERMMQQLLLIMKYWLFDYWKTILENNKGKRYRCRNAYRDDIDKENGISKEEETHM